MRTRSDECDDDGGLISSRDLDMPPNLSLYSTRLNLMPTNPAIYTLFDSLSRVGLHKVILLQVYEGFMYDRIGGSAATVLGSVDWENIYGRAGVSCRREFSALLVLPRILIPRSLSYVYISFCTPHSL